MPHVALAGPIEMAALSRRFVPADHRSGDAILKADACYLDSAGSALLVECVVVEGYLRQSFFVLVSGRDGGATIRLLPRTSPEKTDGVKQCVAWIAASILRAVAGARFDRSNLEPEFLEPLRSDSLRSDRLVVEAPRHPFQGGTAPRPGP